jgi:hypothetical protein
VSLPKSSYIELPVLQELIAVGGADEVRFLYERLIAYFPQLEDEEIRAIKTGTHKNWRKAVQTAGKTLDDNRYLHRKNGFWSITEKGREIALSETTGIILSKASDSPLTHIEVQNLLIEIGESLGFYAQSEFEYFDVIWRETQLSQRISHVFEVQSKGNIDSAFAKLKRAYQSQRSKPFLVLASEQDLNRARQSLQREFNDLASAVSILTFVQVKKVHQNLKSISDILPNLLNS